jgi:pSer/pThr/pTyr-binding forkhead associated (FHA) protein
MARLVLLSEGFTGRSFELKSETTTVGRLPDNVFDIPESSVSSHHAEIVLRGNDVFVRDLDSTNGTFINGEQIQGEAVVKPGQILRLGTVEMRLETGEAPAPTKKKSQLEHTRPIPQGVKLDELQGAGAPPQFDKQTGFEKRSNKGQKIFAVLVIVVGVLLVGALVWVLLQKR